MTFLPLLLRFWWAPVIAVLLMTTAFYRHSAQSAKSELVTYRAEVEAVGKAAEAAAKLKDAENLARMEKANAENLRTRAALNSTIAKLRSQLASSGIVPSAPSGSSRPDLACFDRAELERASGSLVEGIRGIVDKGSAATVDLNTAKNWAQSQTPAPPNSK